MLAEGVFPSSSTDASDLDFRIECTDQAAPDPIGLNIITKTHQWMDGLATNGLVIRHRIQNESEDDLPEVFVSQHMDANVYLEQFSGFDD